MLQMTSAEWKSRSDALPEEVDAALKENIPFRVLDVRSTPEYTAYHIPGAVLAPIDTLPEVIDELDKDATWVVVCEHGVRSKAAHAFLTMQGFHHVINMVGGMCRWSGEVERGS
jgi:rhodanese-related sulfurtransferase